MDIGSEDICLKCNQKAFSADEDLHNQLDKMMHSVDISQSIFPSKGLMEKNGHCDRNKGFPSTTKQ